MLKVLLKLHVYSIPFLFFQVAALAQATLTSSQYFQVQLQRVKSFEQTNGVTSTSKADFQPAWLEEIDIRTETRDFDWEEQQFLVRVSPSTRKIRAAQSQLYNSIVDKFAQEDNKYYRDIIEKSYEDWLNLYESHLQLTVYKSLLLVYEDIKTVLIRLASYDDVNAKDIIEVQEDILETSEKIEWLDWELEKELAGAVPSFEDMISVPEVEAIVINYVNDSNNFLKNNRQDNRKNILSAEIALEEAEAKRLFDFFQIQYNGPHSDGLQERIAIGAGLKIPFSSDRALKIEELKLEKSMLDREQAIDKIMQQDILQQNKKEFSVAHKEWQQHRQINEEHEKQMNQLVQVLLQTKKLDPLLPLYQQITSHKKGLKEIQLKLKIYKLYISFLGENGLLFKMPFTNHLKQLNN